MKVSSFGFNTSITRCIALVLLCLIGVTATQPAHAQREQPESNRKALAIYGDAAQFQNNGAFELAIEEWQKFLKEYPKDPSAGKAQHYLGVAYIQNQQFDKAIDSFRRALRDPKLEVREETLINLSWCLFNQARSAKPDSAEQRSGYEEAQKSLSEFMKSYADGDFADQALFYLGEIAYSKGDARQSIRHYKQLLDSRRFADSKLRPDALYAIAVAYEEQKDSRQAAKHFQELLQKYPKHRLVPEVSVRAADLMLSQDDAAAAERLLSGVDETGEFTDYVLLRLGYALSKQGKNDEASQMYLQLLRDHPDSPHVGTAAISVGQSLYQAGKYDEAVEQFESALKGKDEQAADAAHWIAITRNRQNKPAEAVKVLESAMEWAGDNVTLQMDYADALYSLPGELEKARRAYELIANGSSEHALAPRAAYNAAFASLQLRDFDKARQWSEWFLKRFPQDPLRSDVGYVVAETLLQSGDHKAAAQAYERLRKGDSSNPSSDFWGIRQSMAFYLAGDYKQAIALAQGVIPKLNQPAQKAEAQFILGASFLYDEQLEAAIEQLSVSHKTNQQWGSADEVLMLLAEAQQRAKDVKAAKQTLELLLKKYPQSRLKSQAEYKLGQLSASVGDYDNAIARYRAILKDPDSSNLQGFARYGIAWSLMQKEEYREALQELEPLLSGQPVGSVEAEAQLAQGVCLRQVGRTEDAVKALKKFLAASPRGVSLGNGLYELGLALTDLERLEEANQYFEQLLTSVPSYPSKDKVLYELAWNYEDLGKSAKSTDLFEQLQKDYPRSEFGAEASYMVAQQWYDRKDYVKAADVYRSVLNATGDAELLEKSLYKLGWSQFEQGEYRSALASFSQQADKFPQGRLAVDALFMSGECAFKNEEYDSALKSYRKARTRLEQEGKRAAASDQVQSLIYLHGAQCYREQKDWDDCEAWLKVIMERYPETPYMSTTLYELGFCKQEQNQTQEALKYYAEVANNYRTEVGARARFMMGEVYFGQRDVEKAILEFQRVMYGFGGDKAPSSIKNWQVKSAFEAARCSEVLIENLRGAARAKAIETAQQFYAFIVDKHNAHDLARQAQSRLGELQKLR